MGNYRTYDDSNLPSLLSLPYLGFVNINDRIYQNTRNFILSQKDEFFYAKGDISGVGSSHTPKNYIWPLALMTQIMTSRSNKEIKNCLDSLLLSAKDNLMHESFNVENPNQITREWFAWANSFFGEMIMHLVQTNPEVLVWLSWKLLCYSYYIISIYRSVMKIIFLFAFLFLLALTQGGSVVVGNGNCVTG